jgi:hypothetical protein
MFIFLDVPFQPRFVRKACYNRSNGKEIIQFHLHSHPVGRVPLLSSQRHRISHWMHMKIQCAWNPKLQRVSFKSIPHSFHMDCTVLSQKILLSWILYHWIKNLSGTGRVNALSDLWIDPNVPTNSCTPDSNDPISYCIIKSQQASWLNW